MTKINGGFFMKAVFTTAIAVTVFASFTAFAAGADRGMDLSRILEKGVNVEEINQNLSTIRAADLSDSLATLGSQASSATLTSALNRSLQTNEGSLNVIQVASVIVKSSNTLKDSRQVGTNLDKSALEMKSSIESSNQAFIQGLAIVVSKIDNENSDSGKAVAKILMMGREIAQGKLSTVEQVRSYDELMRAVTQLLETKKAKTSEEALGMALKDLGLTKEQADQKLKDLLGCQA
jgi:uncharacterized protein YjiS (DUF1127 family)